MKTPTIGPSGPSFLSLILLAIANCSSINPALLSGFTWSKGLLAAEEGLRHA